MRSDNFQAMVEKMPDNELFRFSLGQALFEEGSYEQAVEHLEICCARKTDWMMPRILLGKACAHLNRTAEARHVLEAALELAIEQNHEAPEAELRALLADLPVSYI